jgi:ComF family protein
MSWLATIPRPNWGVCLPSACHVCGTWPAVPVGQPICKDCVLAFTDTAARCKRCALRLDTTTSGHCGACVRHDPWLDSAVAAVDYSYPWNHLIARFKFHGDTAWAHTFARLMANAPDAHDLLELCDTLAPLPLTPKRLGERGYNQAWLLAQALQKATPDCRAGKRLALPLVKVLDTPQQHELTRKDRLHNLDTAFSVQPSEGVRLHQSRVLLVDDIMTTGATLRAAAKALKIAGAREVHALVFARTPAP